MAAIGADRTYEELTRLFSLYRLCELNRRYYGKRAAHYEHLQTGFLVLAAALSAVALGVLLGFEPAAAPKPDWFRSFAAALAGISAIVTTVVQYFKWDEQARRFYFLHQSYGHLFSQIEALMAEIRRSGEVTEQQVGASKSLHDALGRIEVLDELDPDRKLIDKLDAKVREAFPDDYIWTNL